MTSLIMASVSPFTRVPWQLLTSAVAFPAIGWFGMWLALTAKKPHYAAGLTILFVIGLPAFAFCVPTLVIDLVLLFVCRAKLAPDFRLIRASRAIA